MLDIEYINAMGAGVDTEFWGFSGNNPYEPQQEPFMKWLYSVGNTTDANIPKLFSTSYGEDEESIPMAWSTRTNAEFIKAGARGISLLFASGDSGKLLCTEMQCIPSWRSFSLSLFPSLVSFSFLVDTLFEKYIYFHLKLLNY